MDISKIFLEEKLLENGFSELIKSADEAQNAQLPSHISIHSEVSLDQAFSMGQDCPSSTLPLHQLTYLTFRSMMKTLFPSECITLRLIMAMVALPKLVPIIAH